MFKTFFKFVNITFMFLSFQTNLVKYSWFSFACVSFGQLLMFAWNFSRERSLLNRRKLVWNGQTMLLWLVSSISTRKLVGFTIFATSHKTCNEKQKLHFWNFDYFEFFEKEHSNEHFSKFWFYLVSLGSIVQVKRPGFFSRF